MSRNDDSASTATDLSFELFDFKLFDDISLCTKGDDPFFEASGPDGSQEQSFATTWCSTMNSLASAEVPTSDETWYPKERKVIDRSQSKLKQEITEFLKGPTKVAWSARQAMNNLVDTSEIYKIVEWFLFETISTMEGGDDEVEEHTENLNRLETLNIQRRGPLSGLDDDDRKKLAQIIVVDGYGTAFNWTLEMYRTFFCLVKVRREKRRGKGARSVAASTAREESLDSANEGQAL